MCWYPSMTSHHHFSKFLKMVSIIYILNLCILQHHALQFVGTEEEHTQRKKRKKKCKHKRKRDGELHAFFFSKEHLVDVNISYTERPTEAERAEMENSSASQWLQGPQLISLSSETLVPLTTVNPQQIFLRSMNNKVPLKMVKKYVFMCSKREKYLYTCVKHVHQVKVISHCKIIV